MDPGRAFPTAAFGLSVSPRQWQGVALPPHLPQRLTAYDGVSLVLLVLPFSRRSSPVIAQSPSRQTPVCAVWACRRRRRRLRSIWLLLVLADWPLADDVAPRRLGLDRKLREEARELRL